MTFHDDVPKSNRLNGPELTIYLAGFIAEKMELERESITLMGVPAASVEFVQYMRQEAAKGHCRDKLLAAARKKLAGMRERAARCCEPMLLTEMFAMGVVARLSCAAEEPNELVVGVSVRTS